MFVYRGSMFTDLLDEFMGLTDSELDERLRANELEQRRSEAERAALLRCRRRVAPTASTDSARSTATCERR
jgi:hypothetical protein